MDGPTKTQLREQDEAVRRFNAAEQALKQARRIGNAAAIESAQAAYDAAEQNYFAKRLGGMAYPEGAGETVCEPSPPSPSELAAAMDYYQDTGDRSALTALEKRMGL